MPRAEIAPVADAEIAKRIHFPEADFVINTEARLSGMATDIAELFRDGVPAGWMEYRDEEGPMGIYSGVIEGRRFLCKSKRTIEQMAIDKEFGNPEIPFPIKPMRFAQLMNGVLSEIRLAPRLHGLIASEESQELAQKIGFSGIEYVEPIVGGVYRNTEAAKVVIYDFIPDLIRSAGQIAAHSYRQFLVAHGIRPTDLRAQQIFEAKEKKLYLIDAELFTLMHQDVELKAKVPESLKPGSTDSL